MTFDLDQYVYEALKAGASGFLLKDMGADDLVGSAIKRRVTDGARRASPDATDHAFAEPEGHGRTQKDTKVREIEYGRTRKETRGH